MSFLTPLFLLGALAIAGPVVFHLIRRITRDRILFSSLMFLTPEPPRLTRRSRLEHWLLLLLRCLALGLLALGFARPFFRESAANNPPGAPARRVAVVVDISASMRRSGLWSDARAQAERALRGLGPADQAAVYTFGRETQPLVGFGEWNSTPVDARLALATARLTETSPGWTGTNLGAALVTAAEALADAGGEKPTGPKQIVLITDLQAGSQLGALQSYEWPKGIELVVEPLRSHSRVNAGLQLLAEAADVDRQSASVVRVRVSNAPDSNREQFKVGWVRTPGGDFVGPSVDTYVPPGQSRVVSLSTAAANGAEAVSLHGDDEDFDNTVYVIPPGQQKITIAYIGGEDANDARQPLFFLQRALPATSRLAVTIVAQSPASALSPAVELAPLTIVTDALPPASAMALHAQALAGKTLFFAPKNVAAAALLGVLGEGRISADEARLTNYAMLAEIDFQHPLFDAFADPRYSDFTKIHFWKYRRLDITGVPGARTLAKFDNGDPALIEFPVGKGRVFVLAGGWNPDDSQLAVSSKFVPLLFSLLEYSGALTAPAAQYFVGDTVPLLATASDWTMVKIPEDGRRVALPAGTKNFAQTTQPGIYRLTSGASTQSFAVNLDAAESRTAPLPLEELERLGAPLAHSQKDAERVVARQAQLQSGEAEGRQKLWRWFIVATLVVLFAESLLAGRTARKPAHAG